MHSYIVIPQILQRKLKDRQDIRLAIDTMNDLRLKHYDIDCIFIPLEVKKLNCLCLICLYTNVCLNI